MNYYHEINNFNIIQSKYTFDILVCGQKGSGKSTFINQFLNEKLVKEKKFIYQVIVFEKGKERYNKLDYFFGPVLRKNKDKLFIEYFTRELVSREILLKMLPKGYFFKKLKTKKEIKNIKEEIKDVK